MPLFFWVVVGFGRRECARNGCYMQGRIPGELVGDDPKVREDYPKAEDYPGGGGPFFRDHEGGTYVDYDFYRKHGEVPSPGIGHRK
ncbi:hypothetical protein MLD38_003626 [Melastoma candidum]|uniref:Uncharacterized protein n=1 Tax=Melastoma candidum TaxID=119954 RepID=A0ACB9S722_9MYRT|nr:hypothetical protein MLD38_003626 [Melastoma candidum]